MLLASRGARVVVNDCDASAAAGVVSEIARAGGQAMANDIAIGPDRRTDQLITKAHAHFGSVDILVNNAGISRPARFGDDSEDDISTVIGVDLLGPYRLMRAAWPIMQNQGRGHILNMASSAALGSGFSGAYAAAKAGLVGLTMEAAQCGRALGIHVNALMPTASTALLDKHPDPQFRAWMHQHFAPEHVARVACDLLDQEGPGTGQIITIGGDLVGRMAFTWRPGVNDSSGSPSPMRIVSSQEDLQKIYREYFPAQDRA